MPLELYHKKKFEFNIIFILCDNQLDICTGAVVQIKAFFSYPFIK